MKLDNRPGAPPEKTDDGRRTHSGTESSKKGDNSSALVKNLPESEKTDGQKPAPTGNKAEYEDDDLGIYEDTDDGDDLTDTEQELERLRLEKRIREENEKLAAEKAKAADKDPEGVAAEDKNEPAKPESSSAPVKESENEKSGKERVIPKAELKIESQLDMKTWPPPTRDTGQRRSGTRQKPRAKTTCMASELAESRNASRLAMESREAMFRRAMSLLSARCTSVRRELSSANRLPFGAQVPKYFYVTQEKPVPMEPLRAWRGYNGNIYFEPIQINQMSDSETEARAKTSIPRASMPPPMTAASKAHSQPDKENRPVADNRADSRLTSKSSQGSLLMSTRQMAILDKQAVLSRYNESLHEDLTWLEGQENTGSLAVRPKTFPERSKKERERDLQYNKERIRKGSVAHKLYVENKARQKPKLSVSGGKFVPPTSMSPLLRTQTQYSLSSNRLTTNSPDPYHLNDSKLPPLDQIRATIKHMDNKSDVSFPSGKPYNRSVTLTDEMKPFVKYSPDVVAKLSQQANVC